MPKESAAVMSEVGQGQTGLALDTKPARTLVGMASSLPANGEVAAETREEIRRETLVRPNAPAATVEERTRTSVVEARLLAMLREAASRTLDEPVQEELAKLKEAAPDSADAQFDVIKTAYAGRGLTALTPAPFNNGNAVACTKEAVDEYDITNMTALAKASPMLALPERSDFTSVPSSIMPASMVSSMK